MLFEIWIVALLLRIYNLETLPSSLMDDEVLSGYVGRFILENGVDLYGNKFPLFYFDKFGDYYIIGPFYLAGLSTYLFGVTAFAVRFPVALFGSLIVFPVYFFTKLIFNNKKVSLFASLFIAIVPWHLVLSRSSTEGIIGSTIFLTGIFLILMFIKESRRLFFVIGAFLILLSYFIYHPFRMYAPLSLLPLPLIFSAILIRRENRKKLLSVILLILFFLGLTVYISSTPWGKGRFEQTSIFSPLARVEGRIQEQIYNTGQNRIFEARLFNNKIIGYGREFINQYFSYFSPVVLSIDTGEENRYDMPAQGLVYITFLIFIGASLLPVKSKLKINSACLVYFFYLLLIAPIPAALTYLGSPNVHRALFLVVLLVIPAAYGVYKINLLKYGKIILLFIFFLLICEFFYFWHQYSVQSDIHNAIRRNDAQKELIVYLKQNESNYEKIYLPSEGTMSLYLLFYKNTFSSSLVGMFNKGYRLDMESFQQYVFTESSCATNDLEFGEEKILVVNKYDCQIPSEFTKVATIKGKNHLLGFDLYSHEGPFLDNK